MAKGPKFDQKNAQKGKNIPAQKKKKAGKKGKK